MKDNGRNCALGTAAYKLSDWASAIERFQAEVANVPDNELAWIGLSMAYLNSQQFEESKAAAEKAVAIDPNDNQANNLIGMYYLNKEDPVQAKAQFMLAIKRDYNNPMAWYYLAIIAREEQDNTTALANLMKAIELAPSFRPPYELSMQIYASMGDEAGVQRFRKALERLK
ncbi:MAG: tetratricopeptide repeat protein [Lewinellaceae bacterium]|nr:tetratricopeptide repeat protein [Lewinellaceae bacterium]